MKKFIAVLLVGIFLFLLSACTADNNDKVPDTTSKVSTENVYKIVLSGHYVADSSMYYEDDVEITFKYDVEEKNYFL